MDNRTRFTTAFLVLLALGLFGSGSAEGWGGDIHRIINRAAAEHLPEAFGAFGQYADELTERSTDADERKSWDDDEGIRHYIDIDDYPAFFAGTLPRAWNDIIALYGIRRVERNGILPWAIEDTYDRLVTRLEVKDWAGAVAAAADLGHYVGDLHNPMHLTVNFDGQLTGQDGIHSRYESRLTRRHLESLVPRPFTAAYMPDPLESAFDWIEGQYPGVEIILAADRVALAETGDDRSDAYYAILWTELGAETQDWVRAAAQRLAGLWYSAWIDAGTPILPGSTPVASLVAFTAAPVPGGIELAWTVADGGAGRFFVQRRTDGGAWEEPPGGAVDATAGPASYTWRDGTAVPGVRYTYRLEAQLRDGTREVWDRSVSVTAGAFAPRIALLGANPVRGGGPLGVSVDLGEPRAVRVTLFDVAGRPVRELYDGTWSAGHHRAELPAAETRALRAGVYFIAVRGTGLSETARVVVLD